MAPETKVVTAETVSLQLPMMVVGPVDLGRLLRELEVIDEVLIQMAIRANHEDHHMPKTSKMMEKTIELNKLNLLQENDRKKLHELLVATREKAPVLHVSFSADPAPAFIEKLMVWFRKEIDPLVLITIGLQPNIGAGCIVRTANRQFDLSLREDFLSKRDLLVSKLVPEVAA